MDNLTHALHGFALAAVAATLPQLAHDPNAMHAAVWAASLGSQAPDFDYVIRVFKGDVAYLRHHRGISHSIPAWVIWPTLFTLLLSLFFPGQAGVLWLWSFLGVIVHVGMDLLTTYGTVAFWPFNKKRIGLDVLMIIDLVLWALGAIGLYMWWIGRTPQQILLATVLPALFYILMRVGIRVYLWRKVRDTLVEYRVRRLSVIPFVGLFRWNFILEGEEGYVAGTAHLRKGILVEKKYPPQAPADRAAWEKQAEQSEIYRVFRWFARHLFIEAEETEAGWRIDMADLAYRFRDRIPMTAHIVLGRDGQVISERLGEKSIKRNRESHT